MHILFSLKTSFKKFNFMLTLDMYFQNSYFLLGHIMLIHTFTKFIIDVLFFFQKNNSNVFLLFVLSCFSFFLGVFSSIFICFD